mgnify:CR=1 FL=1
MPGVITRGDLLSADFDDGRTVGELMLPGPIVTHADQPLRAVAEEMAMEDITALPVVDRGGETRVVGIVTLRHLLTGRRRDQVEARERERILRIRMLAPAERSPSWSEPDK